VIALSIALGVVGLAALWTARDVILRLHRGSEAREALDAARAAETAAREAATATGAEVAKVRAEVERVRAELSSVKAGAVFGGRR